MTQPNIEEALRLASTAVENLDDRYKVVAFRVILDHILTSTTSPQYAQDTTLKEATSDSSGTFAPLAKLAAYTGLPADQLQLIYHLSDDGAITVTGYPLKSDRPLATAARELALLLGLAIERGLGQRMTAAQLIQELRNHKAYDPANFAHHMDKRDLLVPKGTPRARSRYYELTGKGEHEALQLLRTLVDEQQRILKGEVP